MAEITGLAGPESVLHDPRQDVYFISNINGALDAVDGNGFISRVDAATMKVDARWIAGGLDGPKGMAIVGDSLYVGDVTAVKKFDRRTGVFQKAIALPGATLINDLTTDGTNVFVSDTGIRPAAGITFAATGTDAIWRIAGDRAAKIASGTSLMQPNGIDFVDGNLWVVSFRGNEKYRLIDGRRVDVSELPRGQLDGLVHLANGTAVVTSWQGNVVYAGDTPLLNGIAAPADIGLDRKRNRLLLPRSAANAVTIHSLTASSLASAVSPE